MESIPYVYRLTDKVTGKRYIGSRYAKSCSPDDLGVTYFTSSSIVSKLFKEDPSRFEKQILVTGDRDYVIRVEHSLLELYDAVKSDEFYNRTNGKAIHPDDIARGNVILHSEKDENGKSVVGVASAAKCHAIKNAEGKSAVAVKNMTALHAANRDENGKSLLAARARKHIDKTKDESGKVIVNVNAGKASHRVRDENGKSVLTMRLHAEKDEFGRSKFAVRCAESFKVMWRCVVCGKTTTPGALSIHQKFTGHVGKEKSE